MSGDTAIAKTALLPPLVWKDADSAISILKEAKAEYEKLAFFTKARPVARVPLGATPASRFARKQFFAAKSGT